MWDEIDNTLTKEFTFDDFAQALNFVNKIGRLAEMQNHHPDIAFGWGYVKVSLTTHSVGRVTDKDKEMARMIDEIK